MEQQLNGINVEVVSPFIEDETFNGKHPKAVATCRFGGNEYELAAFGASKLKRLSGIAVGDSFTADVKQNAYGWMVADLPQDGAPPRQAAPAQAPAAPAQAAAAPVARVNPAERAQKEFVPVAGGLFVALAAVVNDVFPDAGEDQKCATTHALTATAFIQLYR